MDTTHDQPAPNPLYEFKILRGLATASFALAFFGSAVFWWFPVGLVLNAVALAIGAIAWLYGARTEERGKLYAISGMALACITIGVVLTIRYGGDKVIPNI